MSTKIRNWNDRIIIYSWTYYWSSNNSNPIRYLWSKKDIYFNNYSELVYIINNIHIFKPVCDNILSTPCWHIMERSEHSGNELYR